MTQGFDEFKKYHNVNYHDGDSHFDERTYQKSNGDDFDCSFVQDCYDHFEAGAASRQAEIDELKKRIKAMQKAAQRIMIAIDDGELEHARRSAIKMFKGESNE